MLRQLHKLALGDRLKLVLALLLTVTTLAIGVVARPLIHLGLTAWHDRGDRMPVPSGSVDDASRLNQTRMQVVRVSGDLATAEVQLRTALRAATTRGLKVTIAGSRHTMGGHTLYPNGISLDLSQFRQMQLQPTTRILTVYSGATWAQVIPYLDRQGYSVAVMQSNNDFSVGGTMSANAHGWQPDRPPFASTVESFRLMLANGKVVRCSRQEHPQLFSLVLGGYGLFGIVLDVNLRVVPNRMYTAHRVTIASRDYVQTYRQQVTADVGMAYGRLSVAPDRFLQEAIVTTYHRVAAAPTATLVPPEPGLARIVMRGSVGSNYGKQLRWQLEKASGGEAGTNVSRNQILNRPATLFENHQQAATDVLHEYFIPPTSLPLFLEKCRQILPKHKVDLLNVTVRNVRPDRDAFLHYANREMFGLVMLFNQQRNPAAEANMQSVTRSLIEAALEVGGTYYLPYRLHATPDQFQRAYPQADRFFQLKRQYDPNELFQNYFYLKYGKQTL
ncbi:MAG: FAD-binding oxidoreductase [Chamaesiphon sp.]|nr:FAD-binding oxidoreductase [Chamaesiphon sp.]